MRVIVPLKLIPDLVEDLFDVCAELIDELG